MVSNRRTMDGVFASVRSVVVVIAGSPLNSAFDALIKEFQPLPVSASV
ncbi:hypothetical protein ACFQ3B_08775 [Stackebrandtia endophytica]|nr:hypothetical protein [Stackebrandtia endophytica]